MFDFEVELKRMGKGWFVLKLAEKYGLKISTTTNYGTEGSMNTRLNTYEKTVHCHRDMLGYLLNNWGKKISGGSPAVSSIDLYNLGKEVFKLM